MDAPRLEAIRTRLTAATLGPWEATAVPDSISWEIRAIGSPSVIGYTEGCYLPSEEQANAELIAHAPEDIAHLLDIAERAAALLDVFKAEPFGTNYAAFTFRLGHKTYVDESDKRVTEALWALADAIGAPDASSAK